MAARSRPVARADAEQTVDLTEAALGCVAVAGEDVLAGDFDEDVDRDLSHRPGR
jgi:hypothetical protein